jgi:hypothetical protein
MDFRETGWNVVYWMHMAQDRHQWRVPVNTVMNLQIHKRGISSLIDLLLASQDGLCYTEPVILVS